MDFLAHVFVVLNSFTDLAWCVLSLVVITHDDSDQSHHNCVD